MTQRRVAPSILSADFANLQKEIEMLNRSEADYIHIDIMDGVFVPNISFGFPVCMAMSRYAKKPMDFHLMITDPLPYLKNCIESGAEIITVHLEACTHLHSTVMEIKKRGAKAGVAINPHVPVEAVFEILPFVDVILLMSVNPGFGGQRFIETTYGRVQRLKSKVMEINPKVIIEVDGGVSISNAAELYEAGADLLVAGSFVFEADDPLRAISDLKKA